MKKIINMVCIVLFSSLFLGLSLTGCAATPSSESTGQYIDSSAITTKVKAQLVNDLGFKAMRAISVSTYKGVVQLSGFVKSKQEIAQAVKIAKSVNGVTAVENSLLVKDKLK